MLCSKVLQIHGKTMYILLLDVDISYHMQLVFFNESVGF